MLGIEGFSVVMAYILCILSAALCVTYGVLTWNKGDEPIKPEDIHWLQKEQQDNNNSEK